MGQLRSSPNLPNGLASSFVRMSQAIAITGEIEDTNASDRRPCCPELHCNGDDQTLNDAIPFELHVMDRNRFNFGGAESGRRRQQDHGLTRVGLGETAESQPAGVGQGHRDQQVDALSLQPNPRAVNRKAGEPCGGANERNHQDCRTGKHAIARWAEAADCQ